MNGSHQTCLIDEIKWYKRIRATEMYNECFLLKQFQSISNICQLPHDVCNKNGHGNLNLCHCAQILSCFS